MENNFFPTRALFWSFWANLLFLFGMIGYFFMDALDYVRPNTINVSSASIIYVILAGIFVVDSTLQLLSLFNTKSSTHRYNFMLVSCIFDKIGSHAYFLGALFAAAALTSSNTIWTFNTIGVCGFVLGATANMAVPGSTILYTWANSLNLLGSLLYLLAIIITYEPIAHIIAILGDSVYLIDAVLYMICWFSDRRLVIVQGEQILLVNK